MWGHSPKWVALGFDARQPPEADWASLWHSTTLRSSRPFRDRAIGAGQAAAQAGVASDLLSSLSWRRSADHFQRTLKCRHWMQAGPALPCHNEYGQDVHRHNRAAPDLRGNAVWPVLVALGVSVPLDAAVQAPIFSATARCPVASDELPCVLDQGVLVVTVVNDQFARLVSRDA